MAIALPGHAANTWRDFLALGDHDRRELIDGLFLEIDVPTRIHEWIVATLLTHLRNWAMERKAGVVLGSGYKIRIDDRHGVMPDVQFFKRGGREIPERGLEQGAPDVVVEVISPSSGRYDRVQKLRWYSAIGVAEYWIVDPERQTLEQLVLEGDTYRIISALSGDEMFSPTSMVGLTVSLAELWSLPEWFTS